MTAPRHSIQAAWPADNAAARQAADRAFWRGGAIEDRPCADLSSGGQRMARLFPERQPAVSARASREDGHPSVQGCSHPRLFDPAAATAAPAHAGEFCWLDYLVGADSARAPDDGWRRPPSAVRVPRTLIALVLAAAVVALGLGIVRAHGEASTFVMGEVQR